MTDLSPAVVVVLVFYFVQDRRDDEQGQETTEKSNQVVDLRVPRKLSQNKFWLFDSTVLKSAIII